MSAKAAILLEWLLVCGRYRMRLATATDYGTTDGEHVWSNPPQIVTGPMVRRHPRRRPLPGAGLETKAFLQRDALAISSGTEKAKQETLAHDENVCLCDSGCGGVVCIRMQTAPHRHHVSACAPKVSLRFSALMCTFRRICAPS